MELKGVRLSVVCIFCPYYISYYGIKETLLTKGRTNHPKIKGGLKNSYFENNATLHAAITQ